MGLTSLRVHITNRSDKTVYMTPSLLSSLKLSGIKTLRLGLGHRVLEVPVRLVKKIGNHLYVPSSISQKLMIPRAGDCFAVKEGANGVRLGPLIGLMTTSRAPSRSSKIRPYILAGHKKYYCFAFHPMDVNWNNETVGAYFMTGNGGWVRKTVPLPDVVYNRMGSRRSEKLPAMVTVKERFQKRGVPLFNWSFFDKSYVYDLLAGEAEAEEHIPESINSPTYAQIKEMLMKYRFVYLKPTSGSLGRGIMRLTYIPGKGYYMRYRRNGQNILLKFNRFVELQRAISRRTAGLGRYVCQQGIRLAEIDNCPIDFRFHLNKDRYNQWVVAGIGAKKAGKGSVTTHLRNGGKVMTPEQALSLTFGARANEILETAKQETIKLAELIERKSKHRVGELGFDIGIDVNGNIWMFEANAKPGRSIFKHPALKKQGKQSLRYLFDYCMYLSKFVSGSDS